jgi:ATP-dependent DNA helicase RecG
MTASEIAKQAATNRKVQISALLRAIVVERKARYPDFQGRKSTFSQFMRRTADTLARQFPLDRRWVTIRGLLSQYQTLDTATRISVLRRVEEILVPPDDNKESAPVAKPETKPQAPITPAPTTKVSSQTIAAKKTPSASGKEEGAPPSPDETPEYKAKPESKAIKDKVLSLHPSQVDVQYVRGVGPKVGALLNNLGIYTAEDLIRHYPRKHLDFQNHLKIAQLQAGQEVTIFGTISSVSAFQSRNANVSILTISIRDATGVISITRFIGGKSNKHLLDRYKAQYPKGAQVLASGIVEPDRFGKKFKLKNAEIEFLGGLGEANDELETIHTGRLVPVYPLTEGLSLRYLRNLIHNALEAYENKIEEPFPEEFRKEYGLIGLTQALRWIHFPEGVEAKDEARQRIVFDELFSIQLQLAWKRHHEDVENSALALHKTEGGLVDKFVAGLPFKLTGAQERVFREIARDMASTKPMHRLVQGDVGSGKTVVAIMAFLIAIENGFQGAMMAPTEILAEQHFRQFQMRLSPLGIRTALLLGRQGKAERREVYQGLTTGQIHIAVGTHALIQEGVEFQNLGLIIIDEQHRFGVKQRAQLKAKGQSPQLLTMTATPIPRTLALTMHGDLDVSEIDELPPGRKPIETRTLTTAQKRQLWEFIRRQVEDGRQAYIVFPLIEESETLSAKAATAEFEKLKQTVFADLRMGLMHGKLKPQEKEEVMDEFRQGKLDILVSTTVIEVGVDVPNATVMVIENADRFGLAQLHQLRGRVGRGGEKSYCFLVADAKSETTKQKLGVLVQTTDGFVVAEKDLELRGPGEFLGTRQSGLPDLCLTDLIADAKILEEARQAAIDMIKKDPDLNNHPILKTQIKAKLDSQAADYMGSG